MKWLKEHKDFLIIPDKILTLPKNFDYETAKIAVEGERKEYSDFYCEWSVVNPATEIQKKGYLIQGFQKATKHEQKRDFAEKLFSEYILIKDRSHFCNKDHATSA